MSDHVEEILQQLTHIREQLNTVMIRTTEATEAACPEIRPLLADIQRLASGVEIRSIVNADVSDLVKERDLLRTVIDALPDYVYVKDTGGQFLLDNLAHARFTGAVSPEEVTGKTDFDFFSHELAQQYFATEQAVVQSGQSSVNREESLTNHEGTSLAVSTTRVPFWDEQGRIAGLVGISRDITHRRQQEMELRYHASFQETVSDAVIVTDMDFRIQSWNRAAETIYGWRGVEVTGKSFDEVLPTRYTLEDTRDGVIQHLLEHGWWRGEVIQRHKYHRDVHILASVTLLRDHEDTPLALVAINQDITEQQSTEHALSAKLQEEHEFQTYLKALHDITIELTLIDGLDNFYRRVIELGRERLGFERLALFLYDAEAGMALGTFGTDAGGRLTDEHQVRFKPQIDGIMQRAFDREERFCIDEQVPLHTALTETGAGWNAAAVLWNGTNSVGWLVADNLLTHTPAAKPLLDTLSLYAMTIGTLLVRKQTEAALRESEEKFRLLMEGAPEAIVISDQHGNITLVNAQVETLFGYDRDELIGQPVETLIPEAVRDIHRQHRTSYAKTPHMRSVAASPEVVIQRRDGTTFDAAIGLSYIKAHDELLVMSFITDITERKQAEETLRLTLEKEKELSELKSRFVSIASHEFRTPLAIILTSTESLAHYRHKMDEIQIDRKLNKIREQVQHLKTLMEEVLELERIQTRHIQFNPVSQDLDWLCRDIIDEFRQIPEVSQELVYNCDQAPVVLPLDSRLIRQVINNLISNAIKYSSAGRRVWVSLEKDDNQVVLGIRDEGIGIPAEDLKHLFEPFHRATNVGTISGTGLGLSITRQAVTRHGGSIRVESQVDNGTTFIVILPTQPDASEPGPV